MTDDRSNRVADLYHAAIERSPGERAGFLAEECADDPEVLREVESLLAHEGQADNLLESPAWKNARSAVETGTFAPAVLQVAQAVAGYRISGRLWSGGMGEVYRATDTKLQRQVALKVLPAGFADNAAWMARFQREARVLASLNHPHIAAIYGLEESGSLRAIAMELVEGPTLAERLARGKIPIQESLGIARQIAEALEYAHEKGIIHRDLKPANVKLRPDGVVKVLDFGLAKAVDADDGPAMSATGVGTILGTPAYMAPEQAAGLAVDRRADIWAFGVVLFEMLSGRQVYARKTTLETLAAVARDDPKWEELPAAIPARVVALLRRCLDRNAKNRLRDIGEARIAIEDSQIPGAKATANPRRHPTAISRAGWIAAAVFAALFAAMLFLNVRPNQATQPVVRLQIAPPENSRFDSSPAVSPDGSRIAFTANSRQATGSQLYVRALDSLAAEPLPGIDNAFQPFWSPDGRSLAYYARQRLCRIDLAGGAPLVLATANYSAGGTWSHEGGILFAPTRTSPLMRIGENGGVSTPVTRLDASRGETSHAWPCYLPGGRRFLFTAYAAGHGGIYAGSLDSPQVVRLLPDETNAQYVNPGYILFNRNGSLLAQPFDVRGLRLTGDPLRLADPGIQAGPQSFAAFSASARVLAYATAAEALTHFRWFDRHGTPLGEVGQPARYFGFALSPDDRSLAASIETPSGWDIGVLDLARGTTSRLTFGGEHSFPRWSPDGRQIAFSVPAGSSSMALHRVRADGSGKEEFVAHFDRGANLWQWTDDGKYLIVTLYSAGGSGPIWAAPVENGAQPFPLVDAPMVHGQPSITSDGKWIAYRATDTGRFEIYVQTLPLGHGKWRISTAGGTRPRWRADGRELFYREGMKMVSVEIKIGPAGLDPGIPKPLFEGPGDSPEYDITPDGRRFLLAIRNEPPGQQPPFTMVFNWLAGVKH